MDGQSDLYGIYKTTGPWAYPAFQQLKLSWFTGIIIDGGINGTKAGIAMQPAGGLVTIGSPSALSNFTVNGTIGIGTTNPTLLATYKLAVNGAIVAKAMDINGTVPASDYVFEKDYKLRSLSETESYVTEHKHLPEVPSAAEFKTNGYNVGTMDDILLRKVEELTLYLIDMQKQNEALKAKVEKLEKTIR